MKKENEKMTAKINDLTFIVNEDLIDMVVMDDYNTSFTITIEEFKALQDLINRFNTKTEDIKWKRN